MRTFQRTLDRTGVLQVDSVNVLQRAHYMPLYSRMGPYDAGLLTPRRRAAAAPARRVLGPRAGVHAGRAVAGHAAPDGGTTAPKRGKWGIVAADPTLEHEPARRGARPRRLHRPRPRRRPAARQGALGLELVGHPQGPRLPLPGRRRGHRRPQQPVRGALRPARAGAARPRCWRRRPRRRRGRQPRAGPPGRPLPRRRHRPCLRDYYRMHREGTSRPAIAELVEDGELVPVTIEGWKRAGVPPPRRPAARAGSTPAPCSARSTRWCGSASAPSSSSTSTTGSRSTPRPDKRVHGYYVLPFLLGDRIVARVDLKADRASGPLLVKAAYAERGAPAETAEELAPSSATSPAGWACRRRSGRAARRPGAGAASLTAPDQLRRSRPGIWGWSLHPLGRVAAAIRTPPGVDSRASHPRQDPPHRRGQDPPPARGGVAGRERDRGRLRRHERRRAPGHDRTSSRSGSPTARPSTT